MMKLPTLSDWSLREAFTPPVVVPLVLIVSFGIWIALRSYLGYGGWPWPPL